MIATLHGRVSEKFLNLVVLECGGVGYGVQMTAGDADRQLIGDDLRVYVYEHIKEDAHTLYGFAQLSDKQLFEQLLSVKNVGPKVAISLLDIGSSQSVRAAIASGDIKRLQSAKGVGRRAAEQIVVELRDKVGLLVSGAAEDIVGRGGVDASDEAAQALMSLGYSEADAVIALQGIDAELPAEERIKLALKGSAL